MRCAVTEVDVANVDHAVLAAFEAMRDFSASKAGASLTPKQFLAAVSIAAVEQANRMGLSGQSAAATLRDVAQGVETL